MNFLKYNWEKYVGRRQPPLRGELILSGNLQWFKRFRFNKDLSKLFIFFADFTNDNGVVSNQYINSDLRMYVVGEFKRRLKKNISFGTKIINELKKDTNNLKHFSIKLEVRNNNSLAGLFRRFCTQWEKFGPNLYAYLLLIEACEEIILEDFKNDPEAKVALLKEVSSRVESEFFKNTKKLEKFSKSYFSAMQKPYIQLLIKMGEYRDQRKAIYEECWYDYSKTFLEELGKITGSRSNLVFLSKKEIIELLQNSKRKPKIILPNLIYADKGKVCSMCGPKVELLRSKIIEKTVSVSSELKGNVANKGKVNGRVRQVVAHNANQTFNQGEILITKMTTPDLIPLIKKAAAIVTDEGGITCHASIVSREFNIPCIIATNYATQVFKTGDTVEVDADNGIVRKI